MQKVHARPDLRPSTCSTDARIRGGVCSLQQLLAVVVSRGNHISRIIVISLTSPLIFYHRHFHWFVLPWCGFFPLQIRVDYFHSVAKCSQICFALEWILCLLWSHADSFRSRVTVVVTVVVIGIVWAQVSSFYEREAVPLRINPRRLPWSDEGSGIGPEEHWRSCSDCRLWAALAATSTDNASTNNAILLRRFSACDSSCGRGVHL